MSDCTYSGDREATFIAYLYEELTPEARALFEQHLSECRLCDNEFVALGGVRSRLAEWTPPEPAWPESRNAEHAISWVPRPRGFTALPWWAQAAAAVLVCGVGLGAANLRVNYDADGLSVSTGWTAVERPSTAAPASVQNASVEVVPAAAAAPVTRAEFEVVVEQLRKKLQQASATRGTSDEVRTLLAESERRQQNEIGLRTVALFQDVQAQREADLTKIERNLSMMNRQLLDQREVNTSMLSLVRLGQR